MEWLRSLGATAAEEHSTVYLWVDQLQGLAVILQIYQLLLDAPEGSPPLARPLALAVLLQCVCNIL